MDNRCQAIRKNTKQGSETMSKLKDAEQMGQRARNSAWKRINSERLVFEALSNAVGYAMQYSDLVSYVAERSRQSATLSNLSQLFRKHKEYGLLETNVSSIQGRDCYTWTLTDLGQDWKHFDIHGSRYLKTDEEESQ